MDRVISISQAMKAAWKGYKDNLPFFLLVTLVILLANGAYYFGVGSIPFQENYSFAQGLLGFIINLVEFILTLFLYLGLVRVSIQVIRGNKASWSDFPSSLKDLLSFFIGSILYTLIWIAGLILLIFPGFIWGMRYSLYAFLIADQHVGGVDSLSLSAKATYGYKWDLFGLILILSILSVLGLIPFGLGYFITIPLWTLTLAYFYHHLTKE